MVKTFSYWNWVRFQRIAVQYPTRGALAKGNRNAYEAGRRWKWLEKHYGEGSKRRQAGNDTNEILARP